MHTMHVHLTFLSIVFFAGFWVAAWLEARREIVSWQRQISIEGNEIIAAQTETELSMKNIYI
jgi:hypothetical protein